VTVVSLVSSRSIACCWQVSKARTGQTFATDINAAMVLGGYAMADRKYSKRFIALESIAQADRAGMWS
jgi:endonuclease YncB( thermonuclease family)